MTGHMRVSRRHFLTTLPAAASVIFLRPRTSAAGNASGSPDGTRHERYLIVNADDFGGDDGTTRGIIAAHDRGIVTSASLMVNMPGATLAVRLAREHPNLSLGLHVNSPRAIGSSTSATFERRGKNSSGSSTRSWT